MRRHFLSIDTMLRLLAVASAARCQPRAGAASTRRRAPHPITSFAPSNRRSAESIRVRAAAPGGGDSGDEVFDVADVVNVDAIRAAVNDDPEVRAQEAKIAAEARNAASLQVDAEMAQEEAKIALEMGATAKDASSQLEQAQEAALADLEAKSAAVLAAEAKMEEIARERRELLEEADGAAVGRARSKWGSTVADDVDEDAERIESAKAATFAAVAGALLSLPLTLAQSPGGVVTLESAAGIFLSCAVFGVTYRYAVRDDLGNDQLKGGSSEPSAWREAWAAPTCTFTGATRGSWRRGRRRRCWRGRACWCSRSRRRRWRRGSRASSSPRSR